MRKELMYLLFVVLTIACGGSDEEINSNQSTEEVITVNDNYKTTEDKAFNLPNFLSNDTFSSNNVIITVDTESANKGRIEKNSVFYTYIPPKSFVGTDSFNYTICSTSQKELCSTATVTLNVSDEGNPEAKNDFYKLTINESKIIDDYLQNDLLVDDTTFFSLDDSNTQGNVSINDDGIITYTSKNDFLGEDSFTYTICDDDETKSCATASIVITVVDPTQFNIPTLLESYYQGVDFSLVGNSLKEALAVKTTNTQTISLSYTPGVWEALKKSDLDPTDNTKVLLIYGYNDSDGIRKTDRSRDKDENGGGSSDWNREHVYPRSLGNPNLGFTGAGADAHSLRPCDADFNSERSNKRFASGSGNAGDSSGGWFPGDEWKGDVARMMMYMYLRYGNQCLPKNVAIGSTNAFDENMIDLLLEWNVEDPISDFEINRNNVIANEQGNRNPFIDNPYLATVIWGGENAENTWE